MDDQEVQKQINQMVEFIKQEAEEKRTKSESPPRRSLTSKTPNGGTGKAKNQARVREERELGLGEEENRTVDDWERGED